MITPTAAPPALTAKDFASPRDVYWCPGCGDHAILATVKKVLAKTGARPENTVFVSGIGCSSRFPYYINTYGFHSIHGRAPTLATGLKIARPEMKVLFTSGYADDAIGSRGIGAKDSAYLAKPFSPEELMAKVRESAGQSR